MSRVAHRAGAYPGFRNMKRPLDPQSSALITRPPRLPLGNKVVTFYFYSNLGTLTRIVLIS